MKAGYEFICSCCKEPHPEDEAINDAQLGPICKSCERQARWATAWLKRAGINRPMDENDVTEQYKSRYNKNEN